MSAVHYRKYQFQMKENLHLYAFYFVISVVFRMYNTTNSFLVQKQNTFELDKQNLETKITKTQSFMIRISNSLNKRLSLETRILKYTNIRMTVFVSLQAYIWMDKSNIRSREILKKTLCLLNKFRFHNID